MTPSDRRPQSRLRLRRPTWRGWFTIGLIAIVVVIVALWAIDYGTLGNRVARNVTVENVHLGRRSGPELHQALARADQQYGTGTVEFIIDGKAHPMSAGDIGLHLDVPATLAGARKVARDEPAPLRPVMWLISWFHPRRAPVRVTLDKSKLASALATLPGQTPVVEPKVVGSVDAIGTTTGRSGFTYDPDEVARRITATARTGTLPLRVPLVARTMEPTVSGVEITRLADEARSLTAHGIGVKVLDRSMTATPSLLRTWITSVVPVGAHHAELAMRPKAVRDAVRAQVGTTLVKATPATFTVEGSQVLLVPQVDGRNCCSLTSGQRILDGLEHHRPQVRLTTIRHAPDFTTAAARKLGITTLLGADLPAQPQQVWHAQPVPPPGSPTSKPSSTTTTTPQPLPKGGGAGQFIVPVPGLAGQNANVDRAIEALRGRIIEPGKTLSLNRILGAPSPDNGYVPAAVATADGPTWISGGGTDLVAAALFEGAYASGLDIPTSTRHRVLPKGVTPGIEATLGWTQPDLVVGNPSDHAVLIWVDRVANGVRVQLFGTPFVQSVDTGRKQTPSGPKNACLAVEVTRTRSFTDGRTRTDTFRADYTPPPGARDDPHRVTCPT